jgi:RNA polymerase sigma-70 factor, ECF subfamily
MATRPAAAAPPDLPRALAAARAGSPDALAVIYRAFGPALYGLALRLTGTRADAEDTVHDVFVGLPEALHRYEERGSLEAWLKRVTARVALMHQRARTRRREVPLDSIADPPAPSAGARHLGLDFALAALPPAQRAVVVLKEIEGYSHEEIGGLLGIRAGASRVRLVRAMRRLRQLLEDE